MSETAQLEPDYPYYDGRPAAVSMLDWVIVLAALAVGFAVLIGLPTPAWIDKTLSNLARATLFSAIPLATLAWRVGPHWNAIFRGFHSSYVGWGVLFGVLNLVVTALIGFVAVNRFDLARNELVGGLSEGNIPGGPAMFYLATGIQLFGEEVITILPFLFLLWLARNSLGMSRGVSVGIAWIGSAILFAAIHLPTYDWNVPQCLLMIGPVRLVLTLAYMKTKSIWSSTIAHVLNDWTMFTAAVVLGGMQ